MDVKQEIDRTRHPDVDQDKLVLYVKKALPAPTMNSLKPLILIEALSIPHSIHIVESLSEETWYRDVNPYQLAPAIEDTETCEETATGERRRLCVFDSTAILLHLAEKHDGGGGGGTFRGGDVAERAAVTSWLVAYAAGLGATGEWWLKLRRPRGMEEALRVVADSVRREYDVLERRLGEPGQGFVALPDRPTIADFAIQPLANAAVAASAGIDFAQWPRLGAWSRRVADLPYVKRAVHRNSRLGMSEEELVEHGLLPAGE
ncbi:Glutathione S-transferase tcpG [Zalerion maritima]|uniref:glutathione transferase n=1 Tax=Zalerion maritima TaxID=339359 RepID=A0AAD5WUL7_9PEZI|nr:Glutathione S-transferase tcpG [Zalerion maritima]